MSGGAAGVGERGRQDRRGRRAVVLATLIGLGCALALFFSHVSPAILTADAGIWSTPRGDMLAALGGHYALLHEPWRFPPTLVTQLNGAPVSIVFTDSAPWLALLFKALPSLQSAGLLGLLLLIAYLLQPLAMVALLRALGVTRVTPLAAGAALSLLSPAWLVRQYGHMALSLHGLLILGLALAVASIRHGLDVPKSAAFLGLLILAAGLHPYHLPPLMLCLTAALCSEVLQRRPGAAIRAALVAVAAGLALGGCAVLLGYGLGGGGAPDPEALGHYGMNLLGPLTPVGSGLAGQMWNGAWFTDPAADPTGGQTFEGMQYLGAGVVLLLGAALIGLRRLAQPPLRPLEWLRRWGPLAAASLLLVAWAVGWNVYAGERLVLAAPKPAGLLLDLLGPFRSHGRFFWTPGYLLLALGVLAASRLPPRRGAAVLLLALVLQLADSAPLRQGLKESLAGAKPDIWMEDARLAGRPWRIWPPFTCAQDPRVRAAVAQAAFVAVRTGGSSNTFPTARGPQEACGADPAEAPASRDEILVRLDPAARRPTGVAASDCRRLPEGLICGRGLAQLTALPPLDGAQELFRPVSTLRFDEAGAARALVSGWHRPDPGSQGVWSRSRAQLRLPLPQEVRGRAVKVELRLTGFSDPPLRPQLVQVVAQDRTLARLEVQPGDFSTHAFVVPGELTKPAELTLMLSVPDARASRLDPRVLGVALQGVRLLAPAGPVVHTAP